MTHYSFTFGDCHELRGKIYIECGLEELLYDACQGIEISRRLVLEYATQRVARGDPVEAPIQRFVASVLQAVIDGEKSTAIARPLGGRGKPSPISPMLTDLVTFAQAGTLRQGGAMRGETGSFATVGKVLDIAERNVSNAHYAQRKRQRRLTLVSSILDRFYVPHTAQEARQWHAELTEIYRDKRAFDKLTPTK